ncbi:hypothetical protein F4824DRAFT_506547 [Ustulina deusta]|nr:hypothetical protein F4824DRAFT_506547 [Ustulina deusta]
MDQFDGVGATSQQPQVLSDKFHKSTEVNVLANIYLYNLFLPQILKGSVKNVVRITSGIADIDWINNYEIEELAVNAMSKAALNVVTAKFSAQYKREGVLFLSVCAGLVDTGHFVERTVSPQFFQSTLRFPANCN